MKVTTWVDIPSIEVDVNISGEDIFMALSNDTEGRPFEYLLKRHINHLGELLKAVPHTEIEKLSPAARDVVVGFLTREAKRWEDAGGAR